MKEKEDVRYYADHNSLGYMTATFHTLEQAQHYATKGLGSRMGDDLIVVGTAVSGERQIPTHLYFKGQEYRLVQ